jgi:hypothetical protein
MTRFLRLPEENWTEIVCVPYSCRQDGSLWPGRQALPEPQMLYFFRLKSMRLSLTLRLLPRVSCDRNLANQIERFGVMAHAYSTYESRYSRDSTKPVARGIKSFELLSSNNRWYIVEMYWDSERPDNPIPDHFLHDNVE